MTLLVIAQIILIDCQKGIASIKCTHCPILQFCENAWVFKRLPRRLFPGPFVPKFVTWWHNVTSHDVMSCCDITCCHIIGHVTQMVPHICPFCSNTTLWNVTWWPWPFTYDPDLVSQPSYGQGQLPYQKSRSLVKRFGQESAHRQTDTQKEGSDSMTSTADAGGKKLGSGYI